jgi:hypothetical protein
MPHYKVYAVTAFSDNESIVEAESPEAAGEMVQQQYLDDGRFGTEPVPISKVEEYTPDYGVTLLMGTNTGGYGGVWGFGADLDAAKKAFRRNGGALGKGYSVIVFDEETDFIGVTPMGVYKWMGNAPTVTEVPATKRKAS